MNRLLPHLMLYAALLAAPAARAQGYVGLGLDYSMTTAPLINFANMAVMNNNSMNTGLHSRGKAARMEAPPAVQRNARELAKVFPASSQAAMAQAFQQSMDVYQQVAAKMGWQRDDLDGAMAAFIVGNYMVFANREVPDEEFAAVAEKQSAETIRNLYEKSAMVGAFMALAYKSQQQKAQPEHAAANLRNSARENLKLVLGADPERLQIDERGVMLVK
ncbi:DUF6683 family protein [Pseudoduganella sp. R-43]|uniref:DUF6683 family protein n=1 Tax=unclassified Pseudoduganella TaxID=2637179 RepID=UPI003CF1A575